MKILILNVGFFSSSEIQKPLQLHVISKNWKHSHVKIHYRFEPTPMIRVEKKMCESEGTKREKFLSRLSYFLFYIYIYIKSEGNGRSTCQNSSLGTYRPSKNRKFQSPNVPLLFSLSRRFYSALCACFIYKLWHYVYFARAFAFFFSFWALARASTSNEWGLENAQKRERKFFFGGDEDRFSLCSSLVVGTIKVRCSVFSFCLE